MSAPGEGAFEIDPRGFMVEAGEQQPEAPLPPSSAEAAADGIASLGRIEEELADVEHALTRLDEGRYGTCDACGATIADARMAEYPAERFCEHHRPTGESAGAE